MNQVELFERAQRLITDIVHRHLNDATVTKDDTEIVNILIQLRYNKRIWLIESKEDVQELWAFVRASDVFCDFLLNVTFEFKARLCSMPGDWKKFVDHLVDSVTCCSINYTNGENAIDVDLFDRLPTEDNLRFRTNCNPWFVTLLMLGYSQQPYLDSVSKLLNVEDGEGNG